MKIKVTDDTVFVEYKRKKEVKKRSSYVTPGSRNILFFTDVVVKFDNSISSHGTQCADEAKKYLEIADCDKKYFAKVLNYGDGWIAMEKIKFTEPYKADINIRDEAEKIVDDLGEKYSIRDLHSENWGILDNGSPIIFDYGL